MNDEDSAIMREIERALAPRKRVSQPMQIGREPRITPVTMKDVFTRAFAKEFGIDLGFMGAYSPEEQDAIIESRKKKLREHERLVRRHAKKTPIPVQIKRHYACGCVELIDAYEFYHTEHCMLAPCDKCSAIYHKRKRVLRALASGNSELMLEGIGFDNPNGSNVPLARAWLEANPL